MSVMLNFVPRWSRLDFAGLGPDHCSFLKWRGSSMWITGDRSCQNCRQKKDQCKVGAHIGSCGVVVVVVCIYYVSYMKSQGEEI
jgi:hypothetical protein